MRSITQEIAGRGKIICHHQGNFNVFCAKKLEFIIDKPVSETELKTKLLETSTQELVERRIDRAKSKGCSAIGEDTIRELLRKNTMNQGEPLDFDSCINRFLS